MREGGGGEEQTVDSLSMGVLVQYRPRPPASQYANYVSREQWRRLVKIRNANWSDTIYMDN